MAEACTFEGGLSSGSRFGGTIVGPIGHVFCLGHHGMTGVFTLWRARNCGIERMKRRANANWSIKNSPVGCRWEAEPKNQIEISKQSRNWFKRESCHGKWGGYNGDHGRSRECGQALRRSFHRNPLGWIPQSWEFDSPPRDCSS